MHLSSTLLPTIIRESWLFMKPCLQLNMDEAIRKSLNILGYDDIRPNQEKVVKEYLKGSDVLFCAPTGSGKSLTFEIAPFLFKHFCNDTTESTVVVVSPLVALMQNQAKTLVDKGVKAIYLQDIYTQTGTNTQKITDLINDVNEGKADIIFASPESLLGEQRSLLVNLSKNRALKAIFIDEAHCIKKFGKGDKKRKLLPYRPKYGQLGEIRSLVEKNVPLIALTATATDCTRQTIIKELCMTNCSQVIVSPEKPNVKYSVEITGKDLVFAFKWLCQLLLSSRENCPRIIVFFRQIKHISEVFEYLQSTLNEKQYVENQEHKTNGYWNRLFAMFHYKTNEKIKNCICDSFQQESGLIRVVLCSTSFSMGLDVKNVHTVVHYGPANDLDDYLQETGRAGRDPAVQCNAILLKYTRCLSSLNISSEMKQYTTATSCRRILLLKPFWDKTKSLSPRHLCCDICTLSCRCLCFCKGNCKCTTMCSYTESSVLQSIRLANTTDNQSDSESTTSGEEFSSDSDFEKYLRRKPQVLSSSESDA